MTARSPVLALAGNLMWTRSGVVWAMWRLKAPAYGYRPHKDKDKARLLHQALFRNLMGESMLLGVSASLDPAAIVERMMEGIDLDAHPAWSAECEATLDTLDQISIGIRTYWLAVPLGTTSITDRLVTSLHASAANLRDTLGAPRPGPGDQEVARRLGQARKVLASIPAPFHPEPATPAQMVWLQIHAQQRGLQADLDLPEAGQLSEELLTTVQGGVVLAEPLLDEGGQSDLDRKALQRWNPLANRFLKVAQPGTPGREVPVSYQSLLVLSNLPSGGMVFPDSEFLGRIDESGLEVDWALRMTTRGSEQVRKENSRALRSLNEQYEQRQDEVSSGVSVLDQVATALSEYAGIMEGDKLEVENRPTVVFAVGGQTPDEAMDRAGALAQFLGDADYKLQQAVGYQEELWLAMLPGRPLTAKVREFAHITPARSLSAAVPMASSELGDLTGAVLGLNISSGMYGVVMHDFGGSRRDVSDSIALVGEKGAGKSLTMKKLAGVVHDRGGRFIAVDRTPMGEWAVYANAITNARIVEVVANRDRETELQWSLDPLRIFGPGKGAQAAQNFLTTLLNIGPTEQLGVLAAEILDPDYLLTHHITALGDLPQHLMNDCKDPQATELARRINVFARKELGRVVFDPSLAPLDIDAPAIIIRTFGLALPTNHELLHEHLFHKMSLEKHLGRALYALIGGLARRICFSDRSVLAVYFLDECHHQTASHEGENELIEFIRDDRKHNAAVVLGSHDGQEDFGGEVLRGLIPTRILMRHRDKNLARRGLGFLDMDATDEDLVEMLMTNTSPVEPGVGVREDRRGEAFMRDSSGNIGRIKILAPAVAERNTAARTSPPELEDDSAPLGAT